MKANRPVCLIIMDGFGRPEDPKVSAINRDNTKYLQMLCKNYGNSLLRASEEAVGLPKGQPGTSDVGHLTIGTGRVKYQPLVEINRSIEDGSFYSNEAFLKAIENAKGKGKSLHLVGIPSNGGVHSHIDHLLELIKLCAKHGLSNNVYIHFVSDGRDAPIRSGKEFLAQVLKIIKETGCGKIADIVGRVYAFDRDKNWDRVELAYNAFVRGKGVQETDPMAAFDHAYEKGETDEFINPIVMVDGAGKPVGLIKKGDSVISYDYRADRERQLAYAFDDTNTLPYTDKDLKLTYVCMTEYDENLKNCLVAYPPKHLKHILSEVLQDRGYRQFKIAETEKFPYITFAFNDGRIEPYENEDRVLVDSVKMKSYAGKPEMSAQKIADEAEKAVRKNIYDCIVINFANCDMVGHSGDKKATEIAVQTVNNCVEQVVEAVRQNDGVAIVTADHGNADIMEYPDGSPCTSHTKALVPVIIVDDKNKDLELKQNGTLADIAPTILKILGEKVPEEMTGTPLF